MDFQNAPTPDFEEILCTYVFWDADYEYHSGFWRKFNFHDDIDKKTIKIMVFRDYLRKYEKFPKIVQTKVVNLVKIYIFCSIHFSIFRYKSYIYIH